MFNSPGEIKSLEIIFEPHLMTEILAQLSLASHYSLINVWHQRDTVETVMRPARVRSKVSHWLSREYVYNSSQLFSASYQQSQEAVFMSIF